MHVPMARLKSAKSRTPAGSNGSLEVLKSLEENSVYYTVSANEHFPIRFANVEVKTTDS